MNFGERLKKIRKNKGFTQEELAEKVGISRSNIANYENNKNMPSVDILVKLSNALDVFIDYIIGYTSIENPKKELEEYLSSLDLTKEEYEKTVDNIKRTQQFHLDSSGLCTDKMEKVMNKIFDTYIDYLKSSPFLIKDEEDIENITIEEMKENNKKIDMHFINMLEMLDKDKILHKEQSNVFPTTDIPQKYPILGKISAGLPLLAVENIEGYMYAPSSKIQQGYDYFFLRVQRR